MPHKAMQEKAARAVERAAVEQQKKNQSYQMLPDSDEDDDGPAPVKKVCLL